MPHHALHLPILRYAVTTPWPLTLATLHVNPREPCVFVQSSSQTRLMDSTPTTSSRLCLSLSPENIPCRYRKSVAVSNTDSVVYMAVAPLAEGYSGTGDITLGYALGTSSPPFLVELRRS